MSNHQGAQFVKMKNIYAICFIIVGVVVLGFSCYFMSSMVEILKRGNRIQDDSSNTNAVYQSSVVMNVSGVGNTVKDDDSSIVAAYESLSNELSSWLAIIGLFATVFGLVIPIGSYLLQRQSLNDEKEELKKKVDDKINDLKNDIRGEKQCLKDDVKDRMKDIKEEMEKIRVQNRDDHQLLINKTKDEISLGLIQRMKPMWNFLASNFDRFLIYDVRMIMTGKVGPGDVVNFLIGFDIYLDCLVRAENAGLIIEAIYKYRPAIDAARNDSSLWQEVCCILKNKIHKSPDFVSGSEFERLIGADTQKYEWLKSLYDEIIPWKFS